MKSIITILLVISFSFACCSKSPVIFTEKFSDENRSYYLYDSVSNQYVLKPWNYELAINENRKYPLVIFLHGAREAGNISYLNHLGYDNPEDSKVDSVALNFQKEHPCFVLIPQTNRFWDNTSLIDQVESFKETYRIDENRIYLIGYSMGGSGSYSFANSYFDDKGQLFAAIIRLAGQSQSEVKDDIARKSSIWLHIGLNDNEKRVKVTRDAYNFLKSHYPDAKETKTDVPIEGYTGKTYSLKINGDDRFKRTEYEGVGHGVATFPFKDSYLIEWMFRHKITFLRNFKF